MVNSSLGILSTLIDFTALWKLPLRVQKTQTGNILYWFSTDGSISPSQTTQSTSVLQLDQLSLLYLQDIIHWNKTNIGGFRANSMEYH
ncbi:MAG: hypothetical protein EZS28_003841 [Streblomastix strix]|uniref:Uncharacterized protein n=1 Tax=Streblomastix strix TaxID=222440 RepID=A0A5J4WZU4_9EUKA|nr:MAG: hypothetical protein EZS28_003841 [Streblomastix strix]